MSAKTPVSLALTRRLNTVNGAANLVQADQARAKALRSRGSAVLADPKDAANSHVPISNSAVAYSVEVRTASC
jgi:hypothetical protein